MREKILEEFGQLLLHLFLATSVNSNGAFYNLPIAQEIRTGLKNCSFQPAPASETLIFQRR